VIIFIIKKEIFMKKLFLVLLVSALVGKSAFAIDIMSFPPSVNPGDVLINAGLGVRGAPAGFISLSRAMSPPPLVASVDFALPIEVPISVGAFIGYQRWRNDDEPWFDDEPVATVTSIIFGGRANWHWNIDIEALDLYTGIFLRHNTAVTALWAGFGRLNSVGGFEFGVQLGARYFFTENVGAVVEVGLPFMAMAGITFRFQP